MRSTFAVALLFGLATTLAAAPIEPSVCDGVAGNLVTNCGFETGNFNGWTVVDPTNNSVVEGDNFDGIGPFSGDFFAALGTVGTDGSLSQTLTTVAGQNYEFGFWLASDGGTPSDFTAEWNGTPAVSLANTPAGPYSLFTFDETATSPSTTISFLSRNDPGFWGLDDVFVVTATPEPSSLGGISMLLALMAGCAVVYKRRKSQTV
jgi:hypothetical protein